MDSGKGLAESLTRNLKDAGCEQKMITLFLRLQENGETGAQCSLLADYRKKLLNAIHEDQARLDCLDYLIYQIRKGKEVYRR